MQTTPDPDSLLAQLAALPDPRRPQGRRYPLPALLGLVILATLQGESSLRGIWVWSRNHWPAIWQPLGFGGSRFPALTTLWNLLCNLDAEAFELLIGRWLEQLFGYPMGGFSADGKMLRASRRDGPEKVLALHLVSLVHHQLGVVMRQRRVVQNVGDTGELGTLLIMLRETPLHEKVITLDAGLLQGGVTRLIIKQGGDYLGVVKHNHRQLKAAVDSWVEEVVLLSDEQCEEYKEHGQGLADTAAKKPSRTPDASTVEKSRGRVEERKIWVEQAGELSDYLKEQWHWFGVQQVGWVQRRQQRHHNEEWEQQTVTFVTSLTAEQASADRLLHMLRQHWVIENRIHWVRDVSYGEDRLHGRRIGQALAWARNIAISLLRKEGFSYIPDGWRYGSAHPRAVLSWITTSRIQN